MKFRTILWRSDPKKLYISIFVSLIGITTGASGGALTETACLYGLVIAQILTGTALTGILFIGTAFTGIPVSFGNIVFSNKGSRPPGSVEETKLLDLEQNF